MTTRMVTALRQGVGDGADVATQVAAEAQEKLGARPELAICYCSPRYDLGAVARGLQAATGGVPLVGCSSAGEFTEAGITKQGVALALLRSDEHRFAVAGARGLSSDPDGCVGAAAAKLPPPEPGFPHVSYIVYHDGLVGRGEEVVIAAAKHLGAGSRICGGSAADDLAFKESHVFCGGEAFTDGVSLCRISSQRVPLAMSCRHGHLPLSPALTITRAEGRVLFEVDGRTAWDVWLEHTREPARREGIDAAELEGMTDTGAFLIRYELGLLTDDGYKVRVPLWKNEDGSLTFGCKLYEGARFRIMESWEEKQLESASLAAESAAAEIPPSERAGALVFDCVCRDIILGARFEESVSGLRIKLGDIPMIGFETYGEICTRGEVSGYHNTSTVVAVLPS